MFEFMSSYLIVKFGLHTSSLLFQSINKHWTKWSHLKVYILEWSSTPQKKRQNVKDNVIQDRGSFNHFAYFFQFSSQRLLTEATASHVCQRVSELILVWKNITTSFQTCSHPKTDSCLFLYVLLVPEDLFMHPVSHHCDFTSPHNLSHTVAYLQLG